MWEPSFEELFDLSLDLLCIAGLDGYFRRVNPAFERAFGYSSEELLSRPFLEFVHPEDRERSRDAFDQLSRGLEVIRFENRNICADGSILWLEWSARPVPGERIFYGAGRDVTARKDAEQRLRQAQETVEADSDELRLLADEQAALRRVATLVAQTKSPAEVFATVTREVGLLSGADLARMERYEPDGTVTGVAGWSRSAEPELAVGTQFALKGVSIAALVWDTCRPVRVDSFADASGPIAEEARALGIRSSVGCPIVFAGRLWGVIAASSKSEAPFPADTESQMAEFTKLVTTAIANAESRDELRLHVKDQAALRRVATLVARGVPPTEILDAVAAEVGQLLGADWAAVHRLEPDGVVTVLASSGDVAPDIPVGAQAMLDDESLVASVLRTGRSDRMESYEGVPGPWAARAHELGLRAAVGAPITVEGRLWGVMIATWSQQGRSPAIDAEGRMANFTELVGTAIANAESRAELDASRARIVATADATRQRIERDLHDGAQQRLVSLALELRGAQAAVPPELGEHRAELARIAQGLTDVLDGLREIARGIHPAVLAEGGLGPALKTLARRSPIPVELDVRAEARLPAPVEVAAYYVVAEALTNAAKHARASVVHVAVEARDRIVGVAVRDDGVGGADPARGSGLLGLKDRAEAIGGTISLQSRPGAGTSLIVELPLDDQAD
jgi:PAS domain S-box-containing protein